MHKTLLLLVVDLVMALVWALMPIVLVAMGRLNYRRLKILRPYMIVANLIVAAMVTTPEILTQVTAAAALQVCYEITVWITRYREERKSKREAI